MNKINQTSADPTPHTFKKLSDKNGIITYYTNPTKSTLHTTSDDIIGYYDKTLSEIGNKKWIWIFDSDGFDMKHALEIQTGTGIAKLLTEKYDHNLLEIKIINPTWHIKSVLSVVWPFLNQNTKNKIKLLGDRYYSVIEFI